MQDIVRLLNNLSYRDLVKICEIEGIKRSGKKADVIKRLVESVPEEKLRAHIMEFMGLGKRILEHEWVPKHRIMKPEEVEELLKKFGIKKWQLPKMLDDDPVAMLLGARPGDVIEITRKSPTAGETKYYRVVIKGISQ